MSTAVPSLKQSLAGIISKRFPWLLHVVTVAGTKDKGLAFRTASGLLHLAGGPDDPAVVRVGDAGTAGNIVLVGPPGAGTGFQINSPDGSTITFSRLACRVISAFASSSMLDLTASRASRYSVI